MRQIERYEKDGNVIEVNSLLTTADAVIDIKQIVVMNNNIAHVFFDTEQDRIIMTETADVFIQKNRAYLSTLVKKAKSNDTGCGCKNCK